MKKAENRIEDCTMGGCEYAGLNGELCYDCGFNPKIDKLRREIPFTVCEDGIKRKLIAPRKVAGEDGN